MVLTFTFIDLSDVFIQIKWLFTCKWRIQAKIFVWV